MTRPPWLIAALIVIARVVFAAANPDRQSGRA
jgi:hypothetical protein